MLIQRLLMDTLKEDADEREGEKTEGDVIVEIGAKMQNSQHVPESSNGEDSRGWSECGKETYSRRDITRFTIRDIVDMLPNFDPTDVTGLNSDQWVKNVEVMMDVHQLDERLVLLAARNKMLKYALKWYESVMDRMMSWYRFSLELRENFPSKCSQAEIHERLRKRIRGKQGLIEYYFEMCQIAKGQIEEENIIYYIIMGMNEYKLSSALKSIRVTTLRELKEHMEWHVKMNGSEGENGKKMNSQSYQSEKTKACESNPKKYENKPDWVRRKECYNYFQQGHIATNCAEMQTEKKVDN